MAAELAIHRTLFLGLGISALYRRYRWLMIKPSFLIRKPTAQDVAKLFEQLTGTQTERAQDGRGASRPREGASRHRACDHVRLTAQAESLPQREKTLPAEVFPRGAGSLRLRTVSYVSHMLQCPRAVSRIWIVPYSSRVCLIGAHRKGEAESDCRTYCQLLCRRHHKLPFSNNLRTG